jgi:hypothetical protein
MAARGQRRGRELTAGYRATANRFDAPTGRVGAMAGGGPVAVPAPMARASP